MICYLFHLLYSL